jgi:hypothetical protein
VKKETLNSDASLVVAWEVSHLSVSSVVAMMEKTLCV